MSESVAARWFAWPNIAVLAPVPLATAAVAWFTWRTLGNDSQATPFLGAIGLFVLSYIGIAISMYPMIVPHHFTLWQAASSEAHSGVPAGRHSRAAAGDPNVRRMVVLGFPRQGWTATSATTETGYRHRSKRVIQ
jgi:hypothetical protein